MRSSYPSVPTTPLYPFSELPARVRNCLDSAGICTIEDLLSWSPARLLCLTAFGRKSLRDVMTFLEKRGLAFGQKYVAQVACPPHLSMLRDWFAGMALQGILAKEGCTSDATMQVLAGTDADRDARMFAFEDARRAYVYADAMLQAREARDAN